MSDKPKNSTNQLQEALASKPKLQSLIESSRQNSVLAKILKMLSDNMGDPAFLGKTEKDILDNIYNKKQREEIELIWRPRLQARKEFWDALKNSGLSEQNCIKFGRNIQSLQPIQLSDELFKLFNRCEFEVFASDVYFTMREWPNRFAMLIRPDGTKIQMQIHDNEDESVSCAFQEYRPLIEPENTDQRPSALLEKVSRALCFRKGSKK